MATAVVTGCNSGIGHAFAQVLLDEGCKVYAIDRIAGFKNSLNDEPVDLLLNIAGIAFSRDKDSLKTTTFDTFEKIFAVNTYGPMFLTQALLPNLLKSSSAKIAIVTSRVGSIGDNSSSGMYAYRSSKAAANSIGKSMAMDLKSKNIITVLLLHPGLVRSGLLSGNDSDQFVNPDETATKLWNNVVKLKGMDYTGKFFHREGFELPW